MARGLRLAAAALLLGAAAPALALVQASGASSGQRSLRVRAQDGALTGISSLVGGVPSGAEGFQHLLKTISKFKAFAASSRKAAAERHGAEETALEAAAKLAGDEESRLALQQSVTASKQSLKETSRIYDQMDKFSESMGSLLQNTFGSQATTCEELVCGEYAECTTTDQGAQCVCNEGYVGMGQDCRPPPEFLPHKLILGNSAAQASDIDVSIFRGNRIAVVFRDASRGGAGRIVVGTVRGAGVAELSPPDQFTLQGEQAFSPVVAGTDSMRLAVAWRDEHRSGNCWVRAALLGGTGIRGADMAITWGEPVHFCKGQGHKMALIPLPSDQIALAYADKTIQAPNNAVAAAGNSFLGVTADSFGNALLASISSTGSISISGQFRFSDQAVCRLEATKVTPTSFVLAARAASAADPLEPGKVIKQEAIAVHAELVENELVFDPNTAVLEPEQGQIWARGVSLVAPNTVAYAYQDGTDMSMKLTVLEVDPASKHLSVATNPTVVRKGFSPYVSMLSVPYTLSDPHTLIYYEDETTKSSMFSVCTWEPTSRRLSHCEDFPWLNQRLRSVSAAHLGDGKSFLAFATEDGVPYYGVIGLSKK